jgi:hypothetical protein
VRGGDSQAAARADRTSKELNGGRGKNIDVDYFASGGDQTAMHRVLQHGTARAGIAAYYDTARAHVSPEGLREGARDLRREERTHHAANPGDADLQ